MKHKISKRMMLPVVYGFLVAWLVVGAWAVFVLIFISHCALLTSIIAISLILFLALVPALRNTATTYSIALHYHRAEYFYDLGNGVEAHLARKMYENKAQKAAMAWLKMKLLKSSFNPLIITFLALIMANVGLFEAIEITVLIAVAVLIAVEIAVFTMLFTAKRYCFDKFGNIKNT